MNVDEAMKRPNKMRGLVALTVAAVLCAGLSSCRECVIRGTVVDFAGEALPGVAVGTADGDRQALTNALGEYKLKCKTGTMELCFIKTGYTAGHLALDIAEPRSVTARPVVLWCLPPGAGIYLLEDYAYRKTFSMAPRPFASKSGGLVYGLNQLPELPETVAGRPQIISHKLPFHDVAVCRLDTTEASPLEAVDTTQEVWVEAEPLVVAVRPIDEPERALWEIQLSDDLAPGVYAVHWGALNGHESTDPRVFLFRVQNSAPTDPPLDKTTEETAEKRAES